MLVQRHKLAHLISADHQSCALCSKLQLYMDIHLKCRIHQHFVPVPSHVSWKTNEHSSMFNFKLSRYVGVFVQMYGVNNCNEWNAEQKHAQTNVRDYYCIVSELSCRIVSSDWRKKELFFIIAQVISDLEEVQLSFSSFIVFGE